MARKTEPEPRPSARQRIGELELERKQITAEIIRLESRGVALAAQPGAVQHAKALALIAGEDEPVAVTDDAGELARLHDRRQVVDRAIALIQEQTAVEEGMERERPEILAVVRKRVLAAISLQRANQEFETFRRKYAALGVLPTAGLKLGGYGETPGNEITRAAEELVRLQIITKREAGFDA